MLMRSTNLQGGPWNRQQVLIVIIDHYGKTVLRPRFENAALGHKNAALGPFGLRPRFLRPRFITNKQNRILKSLISEIKEKVADWHQWSARNTEIYRNHQYIYTLE